MTDRFEETFEALLGSVKDKIANVEESRPPKETSRESRKDPYSGEHADEDYSEDDYTMDSELGDSETGDTGDGDDARPAGRSVRAEPAGAFVASEGRVERFVKLAKGAYLVPNYVSDYLMKNLSLGEQSVFHRLYRLSRGFHKKTEPITVRSLAESCGLSPKLTANIIKALASKRILKIIYSNPFTKKVKFKLVLPREVEQKMVVCGICHNLILDDEEWKYYPITVPVNGRSQAVAGHVECVEGEPFLESRPVA